MRTAIDPDDHGPGWSVRYRRPVRVVYVTRDRRVYQLGGLAAVPIIAVTAPVWLAVGIAGIAGISIIVLTAALMIAGHKLGEVAERAFDKFWPASR